MTEIVVCSLPRGQNNINNIVTKGQYINSDSFINHFLPKIKIKGSINIFIRKEIQFGTILYSTLRRSVKLHVCIMGFKISQIYLRKMWALTN